MIVLSSLVMGVALVLGTGLLAPWLAMGVPFAVRAGALGVLVSACGAIFFLCTLLTGALRVGQLTRMLRRRPARG
ncbi:MAG: hypothetical protein JSS20_03270, partial [Proteobacteria bacterium]|nr:hypothetical protein [Pseudomonadota bacterium]